MHIVLVLVTIRPEMRTEFEEALLIRRANPSSRTGRCGDSTSAITPTIRLDGCTRGLRRPDAHANIVARRTFLAYDAWPSERIIERRCFDASVGTFS
jgi:hypothetical protein